MPRLAIVSVMEGDAWGASEELWHATALRARSQGWDVLASVFNHKEWSPKLDELVAAGVVVSRRRRRRSRARIHAGLVRRVTPPLAAVRRFKPWVVLVNLGGTYDLAWQSDILGDLLRLASPDLPLVALCHGFDATGQLTEGGRRAAAQSLVHFTRVLFTSDGHRRAVTQQLGVELPGGTFQNPLRPGKRLPWPSSETLRLACVGRLVVDKGHAALLDALAAVSWRDEQWSLTIYGLGPEKQTLLEQIDRLDLGSRVSFAGHVKIEHIWRIEQVLVSPSRREGMSLALLETMRAGRPAVVTALPGADELVQPGVSGFLIATPERDDVGIALNALWSARDRLPEMGVEAARGAERWLSSDPVGDLLQGFDNLLYGIPRTIRNLGMRDLIRTARQKR